MGIFDIDENIERDPRELKFSTFYTRLVTNLEKSVEEVVRYGEEENDEVKLCGSHILYTSSATIFFTVDVKRKNPKTGRWIQMITQQIGGFSIDRLPDIVDFVHSLQLSVVSYSGENWDKWMRDPKKYINREIWIKLFELDAKTIQDLDEDEYY